MKFRDESYGERDSRMMWRLLAKNSVITCSTIGGSDTPAAAAAAMVVWLSRLKLKGSIEVPKPLKNELRQHHG